MGDLVVVVPGITGSALRSEQGDVWDLSAAAIAGGLLRTAATLSRMRLPAGIGDAAPSDPAHVLTPSGLIQGLHMWPGFWVGSGYGRLLRVLAGSRPERVVPFAYDWRLSNRHTARLLGTAISAALAQWRERPGHGDAQVVLVCHSMGGLVARYYLDCLGGAATTRRLVTIGTPFSGSVKAIRALTGGLIPRVGRLDRALVDVARTFPAVHQLLPSYRCVNVTGGPVDLASHGLADLTTASVADGLAFHQELSAAHPASPSYEEHYFGGKRQPTDQSVTPGPAGLAYERTQRGTDHAGDGTVPFFSSLPAHLPSSAAGNHFAARHARLQLHGPLLDLVADKVDAIDHGAALSPPTELALDVPDVVVAGEPLVVAVTADEPDLFLQAAVSTAGDHHIPVEPHGDGSYSCTLHDLPPGPHTISVATVNHPAAGSISDVVLVVDP